MDKSRTDLTAYHDPDCDDLGREKREEDTAARIEAHIAARTPELMASADAGRVLYQAVWLAAEKYAEREIGDGVILVDTIIKSYRPSAEYPYWLYDADGEGMAYYRTREARDDAAARALADYRTPDDRWDEAVEWVAVGEVTHFAQCIDKKMRPTETELDGGYDSDGAYWGDALWRGTYTMAPVK